MSNREAAIYIENNPKFGSIIKCKDVEEADALEDYLTANDVSDFSVRFSEGLVEFIVPSVSFDRIGELVTQFYNRRSDLDADDGSR